MTRPLFSIMKNTGISALTDMTKIDDQSPESTQAARLRDIFFNTRQSINEQYGLTCWGRDVAEARRHLEGLEFLFECEMQRRLLEK